MNKHPMIRKIYLYIFTLVGLSLVTVGCVRLVGLGLKTFVFTKADVYYDYPVARQIKAPPTEESQTTESEQPSKEEIEEYQQKQRSSRRQREAADSLAMIIVGLPLYLYHWRLVKKEKEENYNSQ